LAGQRIFLDLSMLSFYIILLSSLAAAPFNTKLNHFPPTNKQEKIRYKIKIMSYFF